MAVNSVDSLDAILPDVVAQPARWSAPGPAELGLAPTAGGRPAPVTER